MGYLLWDASLVPFSSHLGLVRHNFPALSSYQQTSSVRSDAAHKVSSLLCPLTPTLHCEEQIPLRSLCPLPEPAFPDFLSKVSGVQGSEKKEIANIGFRNVKTQQAQGHSFHLCFPPEVVILLLLHLYPNSLLLYTRFPSGDRAKPDTTDTSTSQLAWPEGSSLQGQLTQGALGESRLGGPRDR